MGEGEEEVTVLVPGSHTAASATALNAPEGGGAPAFQMVSGLLPWWLPKCVSRFFGT